MNLRPMSQLSASIQAKVKGVAANVGIRTTFPSVYYYKFTSMLKKELYYNVVAKDNRTSKKQSTGWLPDANGGCTYTVPLRYSHIIPMYYNKIIRFLEKHNCRSNL